MRRIVPGLLALTLTAGGYVVADVLDLAPGVLTRQAPTPLPPPTHPDAPAALVPLPTAPQASPILSSLPTMNPAPAGAALADVLDAALADPALGPSVGMSVRDAVTGTQLYARDAARPRVVASAQKLLTAAAITATLDPSARMTTSVRSPRPGDLILIGGGDTMLARGDGDPDAVAGRAGLRDLARQVARRIGPASEVPVLHLRLDMTYAADPRGEAGTAYPPGWVWADVRAGYTQGVGMIGLAEDRPRPGAPSPTDPGDVVLRAFIDHLQEFLGPGRSYESTDRGRTRTSPTPAGAKLLGEVHSAAYRDVLALALDESDNALTENLARQAAIAAGRDGGFEDNARFVTDTLRDLGYDVEGTTLLDTSGLSGGQRTTVALLSRLTADAVRGRRPGLGDAIARLPVAGLDGSLHGRFLTAPADAAAGIARAKTGTLTGVSSLVGTTVDADDRELVFAVVADRVPAATGTPGARAALDRAVAALTACGCR